MTIGNIRVVIGVVQHIHVRADLILDVTKARIDRASLRAVGRMQSPNWYCCTRDMFSFEP